MLGQGTEMGMRQRSGQEPGKVFIRGLDFVLKGMGNTGRKMLKFLSFSKQSSPCLFHFLCRSQHPPPPQHPGQICRIQDHLTSCCRMYQPHLGFSCCLAPPRSGTCHCPKKDAKWPHDCSPLESFKCLGLSRNYK